MHRYEPSPASDRERAGLRGPVKICFEQTKFHHGRDVLSAKTEYSVDGRLLVSRVGTPECVTAFAYDNRGLLRTTVSVKPGEVGRETIYEYDDAGKCLSIRNSENGDRTDFQFHANGHKTAIRQFDSAAIRYTHTCAFGGSVWDAALAGFGVPSGGTVRTIYDERDLGMEAQVRDKNDQLVARVVRKYNSSGLMIEELPTAENPLLMFPERHPAQEWPQEDSARAEGLTKALKTVLGGRAPVGMWHTYDENGRLVSVRENTFVFQRNTTIRYNDRGDIALEQTSYAANSVVPLGRAFSVGADGSLAPTDLGQQPESPGLPPSSEINYTYESADQYNWTQQTATDILNPAGPVTTIRRRELWYY